MYLILILLLVFNFGTSNLYKLDENDDRVAKLIKTIFKTDFETNSKRQTSVIDEFITTENNHQDTVAVNEVKEHRESVPEFCASDNCVPFHLCKNNTIIKAGEGLLDVRFRPESQCHYLEVCCKPEEVGDHKQDFEPKSLEQKGCGYRFTQGIGPRILENENEAQYGEFPWMIAVMNEVTMEDDTINVYLCGGSLIHPEVVLTAAHCIHQASVKKLKIRAGEWDTQTTNEIWPHQDRYVKKCVIHEKFYVAALQNDIALLFLHEPVELIGNVRTICLPPLNYDFEKITCFASGWGKDLFGKEGNYQVILKKIDLPIVNHSKCETSLRKTRLGRHFQLHKSFLCAGGLSGKDTCKGDGGSPLVCPISKDSHIYYQAGIVAWGIGCGENEIPGVYVDVAKFRSWIDNYMIKFGLSSKYYKHD